MSSSSTTFLEAETDNNEHWLPPAEFLAQLAIRPGMSVAEIGAGRAFYTLPIARQVGPAGNVFAIEWRPWILGETQAHLLGPNAPENVRLIVGRAAETRLPDACCDLVILADIWHVLEHQDATLDEVRRILRENGRLAILNWRPGALCPPGPPLEHRVSMQKTICSVEMKSWSLVQATEIGQEGYLLVFEVTDESVQS